MEQLFSSSRFVQRRLDGAGLLSSFSLRPARTEQAEMRREALQDQRMLIPRIQRDQHPVGESKNVIRE
jgi:hypothetical protein